MSGTSQKITRKRKRSVFQLPSLMTLSSEREPKLSRQELEALHEEKREFQEESGEYAAYEREREAKVRVAQTSVARESEQVRELLKYVVRGEQDKTEALVKGNPHLALLKGTVTDLSQREFKHISGFQYALWALDWHMWQMLLKYLPKDIAALQLAELEEKGTAHGKHFSLTPLIAALNSYAKNYNALVKTCVWGKIEAHWCRIVGGNQLLLPAHVVNEYCHPTQPFYLRTQFAEERLVRNRQCNVGEWFTGVYNGGKLGDKFGMLRYNFKQPEAAINLMWIQNIAMADAEALQSLSKIRQQQLEELRVELQYLMGVKGLLNGYFPSEVSRTVLGYM